MGYENKMLRGVARNDASPDDLSRSTTEKPWIAVVETFAIGGGCQHLLVMDYVLADAAAYLALPARKEGIIPGMANLRLPRFTGDRLARQAIMYGRRINCDSPEGRLICDEVTPADQITALSLKSLISYYLKYRECRRQSTSIQSWARASGSVSAVPFPFRQGAGLLPLQRWTDFEFLNGIGMCNILLPNRQL